jgi:hypothetical protein
MFFKEPEPEVLQIIIIINQEPPNTGNFSMCPPTPPVIPMHRITLVHPITWNEKLKVHPLTLDQKLKVHPISLNEKLKVHPFT